MPVYNYCFAEVKVSFVLKQQVLGKVECKRKVFLRKDATQKTPNLQKFE